VGEDAGEVFSSPGDLSGPHPSGPNKTYLIIQTMRTGRNPQINRSAVPSVRYSDIRNSGAIVVIVTLVLIVAGCGSSSSEGSKPPNYAKALAGAPAPLAALHRQANNLLPGGVDAYERRIAALRGYPIVVNVWASWCGPCRFEFPTFQRLSARYGRRVAFIGVDSQDSEDKAATYLRDTPVPYPSYSDPDEEIANELGTIGLPATAFYDRGGELVYLGHKPYFEDAELQADIERYAVGGSAEGG
jgi:cytochrome c biogenesis protein CcmG, thiol:disulfide interchange protein DsbE